MARTSIRSFQVTDGEIANADINVAAAIANSKLDLASISQAIMLTHASGLRLEAAAPALVLRETGFDPDLGGLWRWRLDGTQVLLERNTAVAGDFSSVQINVSVASDVFKVLGRLELQSQPSAPASMVFTSAIAAGSAFDNGLYRNTDNRLHFRDNSSVDNTLAYVGESPTGSATSGQVAFWDSSSSITGEIGLTWDSAGDFLRIAGDVNPSLQLRETDQTLPAGLFRITSSGQLLRFEQNTAAAGDFSTKVVVLRLNSAFVGVLAPQLRVEDTAEPYLTLYETDQVTESGALWRMLLSGGDVFFQMNTAVGGDFSTVTTPLQLDSAVVTSNVEHRFMDRLDISSGTNPFIRFSATIADSTVARTLFVTPAFRLTYRDNAAVVNTLAYTTDATNHRISSADPAFELRDTDGVLPAGLWRIRMDGAFDSFRVERNTAAAGDFSTYSQAIELIPHPNDSSSAELLVNGGISLGNHTIANADTGELYVASDDADRLHYEDSSNVDNALAYLSDIGNTVLVSEYVVREVPTGAINGVNTTFTLANTPESGTEMVFLNGLLQNLGAGNDYTISGTTITFNDAPATGDVLLVTYIVA